MTEKELYHKLIFDLKTLSLPINEVTLSLRPYSKTYYGRYFPSYDDKVATPKLFIYPYENKQGDFLEYDTILSTAIHEMVHHIQHCDSSFIRRKGVMHDTNFWKLYNHYISRATKYNMIGGVKYEVQRQHIL